MPRINWIECLRLAKQPSLLVLGLWVKLRAYLWRVHNAPLSKALALVQNIGLGCLFLMVSTALLAQSVADEGKKVDNIGASSQCYKTFLSTSNDPQDQ